MKDNVNRSDFAPGIFWMAITALAGIVAIPARAAADEVLPKKVLVDFSPDRGIDGMCIDAKGRIFGATSFHPRAKSSPSFPFRRS